MFRIHSKRQLGVPAGANSTVTVRVMDAEGPSGSVAVTVTTAVPSKLSSLASSTSWPSVMRTASKSGRSERAS